MVQIVATTERLWLDASSALLCGVCFDDAPVSFSFLRLLRIFRLLFFTVLLRFCIKPCSTYTRAAAHVFTGTETWVHARAPTRCCFHLHTSAPMCASAHEGHVPIRQRSFARRCTKARSRTLATLCKRAHRIPRIKNNWGIAFKKCTLISGKIFLINNHLIHVLIKP